MARRIIRISCRLAPVPMAVLLAAPLAGQSGETPVSRAIVQPLPPEGVSDLNSALRRLARNSRNLDALIDAGNASLELNDIDAAIGFFGRAEEVSPGNPRAKAGLAAAFVRSERPIEALRLFEEAEQGGASTPALSADRGLAYDLVGNNTAAQTEYGKALARKPSDDLTRRLALSKAIAGDREGFEKALYPLLAKRDFAAYRTRAFGLAILGEEDEAIAIAEAVMPRELSARIAPYLRYMRRLTPSQQAAAANLGIFPRAAQIGRDDPRIAAYSGSSSAVRGADTGLAPAGRPLGSVAREDTRSQRRRPDRGVSSVENTQSSRDTRIARAARIDRRSASDPLARARAPERVRIASADRAIPPAEPASEQAVEVDATRDEDLVSRSAGRLSSGDSPQPGFDLAEVRNPGRGGPDEAARSPAAPDRMPGKVADAFANFALPAKSAPQAELGAVDITAIEPPREIGDDSRPEPEKPAHPRRHWVQLATGRDRNALKFDWRRFSRKASEILDDLSPHVTPWGEANRLLAGPYDSPDAARKVVNSLKEAGIDTFAYTSPEGQEIEALK